MLTIYPEMEDMLRVSPDKGARSKSGHFAIAFDKNRDASTGSITGQSLLECWSYERSANYLVVDDLCEGGGTFLGLVDEFHKEFPDYKRPLNLYVTHGLFTKNAIPRLLEKYATIYTYIMSCEQYTALTPEERKRVKPMYLVDFKATNK